MSESDDPQYKSVNHALKCAFGNRAPYKSPSITPSTGGGDGSTWDERAGDAGNIKAEVRRTLEGVFLNVVHVLYIDELTDSPSEIEHLNKSMFELYERIQSENSNADIAYVHHLVRLWAGITDEVTYKGKTGPSTDDYWAEALGVTTRTLRNWKGSGYTSGNNKRSGINDILDRWLGTAIGILKPVFRQNGWVE